MSDSDTRLSCADYTWSALSHVTALAVIRDLGFDGVDLGIFGDLTHLHVSAMVADPVGYAAVVGARLATAGLTVADVFLTPHEQLDVFAPTNSDPDDQRRSLEILAATVRFTSELGASGITLLPGVRRPGRPRGEAITAAAQGLLARTDLVRDAGLRLSFEPHLGSVTDTAELAGDLVEAVPGLEITLDPAHLVFGGAEAGDFRALAPHVRHVQLRAGGLGTMQARLPDNEIDFGTLLAQLFDAGYREWFAVEYVWMEKWAADRVDNLSETARLKAHIEQLLAAR